LSPFPKGLVDVEGHIIISGIKEHQRYQQREDEHWPAEVGPFLRDGPVSLDRQPFEDSGCPTGPPAESPAKEKRTEDLGDGIMNEDSGESSSSKEVGQVKNVLFELEVFMFYHTQKDHEGQADHENGNSSS